MDKKYVKIICKGDQAHNNIAVGYNTKVIDMETEEEIAGIQSIDIRILPDDIISATVKIIPSEIEIEAKADFKIVDVTSLKNNWIKRFLREWRLHHGF